MRFKLIKFLVIGWSALMCISACSQTQNEKAMEHKVNLTEQEWREKLSPGQYYILREKGTEPPFTGQFLLNKEKGIYKCAGCGNELFTDEMKFESHCGWPSFDREIEGGKIKQTVDLSHGMRRTEITCARCGGHLGHIFDDGPTATGNRYCVNSEALTFEKAKTSKESNPTATIMLGAGCFWCVEAVFSELKGVETVVSGYSGGETIHPTYKQVCTGETGHAEVVKIVYRPREISLKKLLEVFFTVHDPTTLNRQGNDVGTQYRSVIFYYTQEQKKIAENIKSTLNEKQVFPQPIVTEISAALPFYPAENYHQEYYEQNQEQPYCKMVIKPKLDKFHKVYKDLLK